MRLEPSDILYGVRVNYQSCRQYLLSKLDVVACEIEAHEIRKKLIAIQKIESQPFFKANEDIE